MQSPTPDRARPVISDQGSAMIITLMVLALVTALSTTVAAVTINNLKSSLRAQEAGAAVSAADAGVAQAMSYLRNTGVRDVDCTQDVPTTLAACVDISWGSAKPISVSIPGKIDQKYEVWIEAVKPFPAFDPGLYVIHSTGTAAGDAARRVTADVEVSTSNVPKGIYANTISGGGSASIARESVFASGCVYERSKLDISGTDAAYGIPAAVHSSEIITDANGSGQYCDGINKAIHDPLPCDTANPFDQDSLGGSLTGTPCAPTQTGYPDYYGAQDLDGDGTTDVRGSFLEDEAALFELYDIRRPALSPAKIDELRTIAQAQGNYWTTASGWTSPDEANAAMFFELPLAGPNPTIDLNDLIGFGRAGNMAADDAACGTKSLTIVILGGDVKLNSNRQISASLFLLEDGAVEKANGTADFIGTMYADSIDLTGNVGLSLDPCFLNNLGPSLLDYRLSGYRELDR